MKDAIASLDDSVSLIICGVHFNEGAMFDLFKATISHPTASLIPFILILGEETRYSTSVIKSIRSVAEVYRVTKFIDLRQLRAQMDEQQTFEAMRAMMYYVLSQK